MELAGSLDFNVGLVAANKDISKSGDICYGADVWLLYCRTGVLCSGGRSRSDGTAARSGVLDIEFAPTEGSVTFRQAGKELGRLTGVPAAVKLAVSMGCEGNSVKLL